MWGSLALAVLAKGLVAIVLFGATAMLFLWLTNGFRQWRKLRPFSGLLLFLAIAAPWHVLAGMRNPGGAAGGMNGHGFWWFYFVNEHFLRFVGRRIPADYNKLPGYLYWTMHLAWLFPWAFFLPLGVAALWRRYVHQRDTLTGHISPHLPKKGQLLTVNEWVYILFIAAEAGCALLAYGEHSIWSFVLLVNLAVFPVIVVARRRIAGLPASPFHRIDPQQTHVAAVVALRGNCAALLFAFDQPGVLHVSRIPAFAPAPGGDHHPGGTDLLERR